MICLIGTHFPQASVSGHVRCVKCLLEHGADATLENHFQQTALVLAAARGHNDIVQSLLAVMVSATTITLTTTTTAESSSIGYEFIFNLFIQFQDYKFIKLNGNISLFILKTPGAYHKGFLNKYNIKTI